MEKVKPVRIQRRRVKGWNMQKASPNGLPVVYVGRPSKWGNPFEVGGDVTPQMAVDRFVIHLSSYFGFIERQTKKAFYPLPVESTEFKEWIKPLKGKNLCCWCKIGDPCHADILLDIANN